MDGSAKLVYLTEDMAMTFSVATGLEGFCTLMHWSGGQANKIKLSPTSVGVFERLLRPVRPPILIIHVIDRS